mmetsp:Transcript_51389/g.95011  ORF Transcript_51389/g.95011 Transcript_51389/m.95011 type:complete len:592 (-) Transcript_51389:136-1911(-)
MRLNGLLPLFVKGDVDAFIYLLSNNLSTMLVGAVFLKDKIGDERVYNYVIPGIGVSMLFGNAYYVMQALMTSAKQNRRDMCAQPFGINTPGLFTFNTSVILAVYTSKGGGRSGPEEEQARELAWKVGVLANFVQGCIEIFLSFIGPWIPRLVPEVALLGSLASVGFAFLFTETFQGTAFKPLVGLIPFYLLMMALYANVRVPKLPASFIPIATGALLAWATSFAKASEVSAATQTLGWHPCRLALDAFEHFPELAPYIAVVFPVALTVSVGTIQCQQLAANAGDEYNLRASMLGDGVATVIAALFGSPYGMTVYLGHSSLKVMGARVGYSILTSVAMIFVCFSGLAAVLLAVVPSQALACVLLFVGLAICCDALAVTPARHHPAFILGLMPGVCNWAVSQAQTFGRALCASADRCPVDPDGQAVWTLDPSLRGLFAMGQGYLLAGIFLASMLVHVVDRQFLEASCWAVCAALCSACGLIHSDALFNPLAGPPDPTGDYTASNWHLFHEFTGAYAILSGIFLFCDVVVQRAWGFYPRGPPMARPADMALAQSCSASLIGEAPLFTRSMLGASHLGASHNEQLAGLNFGEGSY